MLPLSQGGSDIVFYVIDGSSSSPQPLLAETVQEAFRVVSPAEVDSYPVCLKLQCRVLTVYHVMNNCMSFKNHSHVDPVTANTIYGCHGNTRSRPCPLCHPSSRWFGRGHSRVGGRVLVPPGLSGCGLESEQERGRSAGRSSRLK